MGRTLLKARRHVGANLKNFIRFAIGSGKIDAGHILDCAQTDTWIGFDFALRSDDGSITNITGRTSGQCDWGSDETLKASVDTFEYEVKGQFHHHRMIVSLKRTGPDTVEFYRHDRDETASFGFPKEFEYRVEAKRVGLP